MCLSTYTCESNKLVEFGEKLASVLRGVKAWASERFLIMIFIMGGPSVSVVTTNRHMILLSYYELLKYVRYKYMT